MNKTFDLTPFYSSIDSPKIQEDLLVASSTITQFIAQYRGKLTISSLYEAIQQYEAIDEALSAIASFAYLNYATNMNDEKVLAFFQMLTENISQMASPLVFFSIEINELPNKEFIDAATSGSFGKYKNFLLDLRKLKPHQLSKELEQLLVEKSVTSASAFSRLFDQTMISLKFSHRGKELLAAEAFDLLSSNDRAVRAEIASSISETLTAKLDLFAFITNILAKDKEIEDRYRKFSKPISARNLSNNIEDELVDNLIQSVTDSYKDTSWRYYKLKAKMLGLQKLEYYDRNAPISFENEEKIEWDEAVEIVLSSYGNFSPKLRQLGEKFFDGGWIDIFPRDGKESGAFAHPTVPSRHPYLLLNYQGKVRDVMTLAHELGHGCHQLLAASRGHIVSQTPLTLAETASIFGEQLTFEALLTRDGSNKKQILAGKIEDIINSVIRQIAFLKFEQMVHDERKGGELSRERLAAIWLEVQRKSLGDGVNLPEAYGCYWSYIPHFIHSPFYVYSYAFGECLVSSLYMKYQTSSDKTAFADQYLAMLSEGGGKHHKELLAGFGLDATEKDFWLTGLERLSRMIDQLEACCNGE